MAEQVIPVQFNIGLSDLLDLAAPVAGEYSQPIPNDEPDGEVVIPSQPNQRQYTVYVDAPEWFVREHNRNHGFQVHGRDQVILWMSPQDIERYTDYKFDEIDSDKLLTRKTLQYMGLI